MKHAHITVTIKRYDKNGMALPGTIYFFYKGDLLNTLQNFYHLVKEIFKLKRQL